MEEKRLSGMAVASLVLGIVGWLFFPIVCPILAIVFGVNARKMIRGSGGKLTGEGMANAGLIIGIVTLALNVIIISAIGSFFFLLKGCSSY